MEDTYFEEIKEEKIFCHFSEPENQQNKLVIMSHGFRGTSVGPARQFVDFQRKVNEEGYSVLRFDQPNSGNSEGDYLNSSFNEWVETVVHLTNKYLEKGYKVALLGQSMGATATVIATNDPRIKGKIPVILIWVPDAKSYVEIEPNEIYEEGAQKYKGTFWLEAKESNFFNALQSYKGGIHLVFGEHDRYVDKRDIEKTISIVKSKNEPVMMLEGFDHSPWNFDTAQKVFERQLDKLNKHF